MYDIKDLCQRNGYGCQSVRSMCSNNLIIASMKADNDLHLKLKGGTRIAIHDVVSAVIRNPDSPQIVSFLLAAPVGLETYYCKCICICIHTYKYK